MNKLTKCCTNCGKDLKKEEPVATVEVDEKEMKKLVKLRNKAIKDGEDTFIYHKHPMLVSYAYYSILYISHQFGYKVIQPHSATEIPAEIEITKLVKKK